MTEYGRMGLVRAVSSDEQPSEDEYARWAREKNRGLPPMPPAALRHAAQTYRDDFPVKPPAESDAPQKCGSGHPSRPPNRE